MMRLALPVAAVILTACSTSDPTLSPTDFTVNRAEDASQVVATIAKVQQATNDDLAQSRLGRQFRHGVPE